MKLRATIVCEWEVQDLAHYNASTLEEAAKNQQQIYEEGGVGVEDMLGFGVVTSVKVEPR